MGSSPSLQKATYTPPTPEELVPYEGKGQYWDCAPDANREVRVSAKGLASKEATTVVKVFKTAATNPKTKDTCALKYEVNKGEWKEWTWNQYYEDTRTVARAMIKLGLGRFQSVNIIGFNSPHWFMANVAAILAGGKAAGIYTTNGPEACQYITEHSEAQIVVVENADQLRKFLQVRDKLPKVAAFVQWTGELPDEVKDDDAVLTWDSLMKLGNGENKADLDAELEKRMDDQKPGECCTLIYTSGTTGPPKAVMISNDNATWTSQVVLSLLPNTAKAQRFVSYLPLSHVAAQMLDIHSPMILASEGTPVTCYFARPDALKGTLVHTLKACRPTYFFGVPRVWEKMREKMLAVGKTVTGPKRSIADWAKKKASAKFEAEQVKGKGEVPFMFGLADSLVLSKVRDALGLDCSEINISGAAPISKEVLGYFGSLNIPIVEVYGMSECTGPQTCGRWNYRQYGSCGPALPGTELKIFHDKDRDKEGEGEICYRGRHIMMGYMKNPDKTRETIDEEGWLHSGDVGRVDDDGLLYITGRIKELIITAGGENVAPVPIEDNIKKELPGISNVMMVGDHRKYNTCLVTLHQEPDEKGGFTNKLTGPSLEVSDAKTIEEAQKDPKWKEYIDNGLKRANELTVSRAARVQKHTILPRDFSPDGGELTATLKLKRPVVTKMYADEIEAMYA